MVLKRNELKHVLWLGLCILYWIITIISPGFKSCYSRKKPRYSRVVTRVWGLAFSIFLFNTWVDDLGVHDETVNCEFCHSYCFPVCLDREIYHCSSLFYISNLMLNSFEAWKLESLVSQRILTITWSHGPSASHWKFWTWSRESLTIC